jgi:MoaA/NifB/PqqE/SkfB family radical SAM enzyme
MRRGLRLAARMHKPMPRSLVHAWALRRPLGELAIELTSYCNLECVMCSVWKGKAHGLDFEHVKRLLRDAYELGARRFTPWGAEQFMRKDFLDVLEYAHALGYRHQVIVSNGAILPDAHIARLAKLSSVRLNLSIDGPREVHDVLRGAGIYDKAVSAARRLHAAGVSVGLSGVLMRETLPGATHIIDLAAEIGLASVSYQPFQTETSGDIDPARFEITDRAALEARLAEILAYARARGVKVWTAQLFPLVPAYLMDGARPIPAGGCMIPSRTIVVDRTGETFPCFFMREESIGNVKARPLAELWHSDTQRALNREALTERCPGCLAASSDVPAFLDR